MLFQVKLHDGRIMRRHVDQLRSRLGDSVDCTSRMDDGPEYDDPIPAIGESTDQETVVVDPESAPDSAHTQQSTTTNAEEPESGEHVPETSTAQGSPESERESPLTTVRRSSRVRQPPQRYDELYN